MAKEDEADVTHHPQEYPITRPDYIRAHKHCFKHREVIVTSDACGCFDCLSVFKPSEIEEWVDEIDDIGQTALCPKCGMDSVIGSNSGFPITKEFLEKMHKHWF